MNDSLIFLYILISSAIRDYIGITIAKLKAKSNLSALEERQNLLSQNISNLKENLGKTESERESIRKEKEFLNSELARRNAEFENLQLKLQEQKDDLEKLQEKFTKEFENLANKILDEKSEKFTLQNKENIKQILNPLQEKIQTFEKKVEDTQKESISMHSALKEQLLGLKDLNQQMTKEANNLTKALKGDSKMQGNWGELVLERVLEKSGLEKDREYFVQQSFTRADGSRVMPDVVLH